MNYRKRDAKNDYDLFDSAIPCQMTARKILAKIIKTKICKNPVSRVLELGCGTGLASLEILKKNRNIELIAVDDDLEVIKIAQGKLNKCQFFVKDALKFLENSRSESFDVIASSFVLHNFTKAKRKVLIAEIFRALKPSSLFITADKIVSDEIGECEVEFSKQTNLFCKHLNQIGRSELKRQWLAHYQRDNRPNRIMIKGEFTRILKQNGFEKIEELCHKNMHRVISALKPKEELL